MLMALLYCDENRIAAAAPACEQMPHGDDYWTEIFAGAITAGKIMETAYITVNHADLRRRLLLLGFDEQIDGFELARELTSSLTPAYMPDQAA